MNKSMVHHTVSHRKYQSTYLEYYGRKQNLKHQLIFVQQGYLLIRIGKLEYVLKQGDLFFLPANVLVGRSFFPKCQSLIVELSTRSAYKMPYQAGFLTKNSLLDALISRINNVSFDLNNQKIQHLYACLFDEIETLTPKLKNERDVLSWIKIQPQNKQDECKNVLLVRQALIQHASGKSNQDLIQTHFQSDALLFNKRCMQILGYIPTR